MILSEMYTQLGKRLEDEGGSTFSNTDKRVAIIIAQRMCATILDEEYLLGLEVKKSNISVRLDPDYLGCQSFSLRENSIVPFANKITSESAIEIHHLSSLSLRITGSFIKPA